MCNGYVHGELLTTLHDLFNNEKLIHTKSSYTLMDKHLKATDLIQSLLNFMKGSAGDFCIEVLCGSVLETYANGNVNFPYTIQYNVYITPKRTEHTKTNTRVFVSKLLANEYYYIAREDLLKNLREVLYRCNEQFDVVTNSQLYHFGSRF